MKKFISILMVLALVCMCVYPAFAIDTTAALTLSVDKPTANAGDIVTVTVSVSKNSNLGALELDVKFDKTAYTPVEGSVTYPISELDHSFLSNVNLNYTDGVRYAGVSMRALTEGGALLTFQLQVVTPGSPLTLVIDIASDGTTLDGEDVTAQVIANSSTSVTVACGHANITIETVVVPPTCTKAGESISVCNVCGEPVTKEIPALGHSFGAWTQATAPTCTQAGTETRNCSRCGATETRDIPASGHNYTATVTQPTCTEQGYTTHICTVCGDVYTDNYVNAYGHSFGTWVQTVAPTCTKNGTDTRACLVCGATETRDVPAKGHRYMATVTQPTCTEQGYTTYACTVCGNTYADNYVAATGHRYSEWIQTNAPTCTQNGTKVHICLNCGVSETQEIPATDHTPGEWVVTTEPTYTQEGERTQTCAVCGEVIATEAIEKLEGLLGDVNGDGKVDAVDARWVLQTAAGMRILENDTVADVNADGKIDAVDARWILQAAAGMRTL